uniref:BHLH domain-containing protein n=1 Tax=Cannabis sativa TaxID=3483 RepID=A0A803PPQ2_CANSA
MSSTSSLCAADIFDQNHHHNNHDDLFNLASGDDLFSILDSLEADVVHFPPLDETAAGFIQAQTTSSSAISETEADTLPKSKRLKVSTVAAAASAEDDAVDRSDGQGNKISHIAVERNRRKQMNENLTVLRSLMPCFYVKRGDQASIIGGVVDYITELQQVLQSLEAKKQRKFYSEVLSPRLVSSSPRGSPMILSPKPPLSPRLMSLPNSPRTPQSISSPYIPPRLQLQQQQTSYLSNEPSPTASSASSNFNTNDLFANSKSALADVEVKFSGSNVLLKTIGIECQLSAEELAQQIQQTFS